MKTGQRKNQSVFRKISKTLLLILIITAVIIFGINAYMLSTTRSRIKEAGAILADGEQFEAILVLGAGVRNGKPTALLQDRLDTGIALYKGGAAPKLIVSGDHSSSAYNEVGVMKNYAMEQGVPEEDIFQDHKGYSTYESVMRARKIFRAEKLIFVSQNYHLYRTLYLADRSGIRALAAPSDLHLYKKMPSYQLREAAARCKDFFTGIFQPPYYAGGEEIDLTGDGRITNS